MLMVELSVNPLNKEKSQHDMAKAVELIAQSGLNFEIGPMGTCIEGEFMEVMQVVERTLTELSRDSADILFTIRGDYTRGRAARLERQIENVVDEVLANTPSNSSAETPGAYDNEFEADYADNRPHASTLQ